MAAIDDPIDFALGADGDLVFTTDIVLSRGSQAVNQAISIRLQTFLGEIFSDKSIGVPYYEEILGQPYDQRNLLRIIREQIVAVADVVRIVSLSSSFNSTTRVVIAKWSVLTSFSTTESGILTTEI